ncbi:helicase-associated domain-containing protein [Herbiconiux solani]|uniref:helicase-associated domain-containing protein n=1 Tax=Herbiconiux solani TaxID=661329 RepID=UPI0008258F50|nr:helicase-associated domain-containing protein [Herbiconiux solani]
MSDSLPLARRLSALDDDALVRLVTERRVPARDIRDFFDLADALLQPASIRLALRDVDREALVRLAASAPAAPAVEAGTPSSGHSTDPLATTDADLVALALAAEAGPDAPEPGALLPYDAVSEVAQAVLAEAGPVTGDDTGGDTGDAGTDAAASRDEAVLLAAAAERAFTTVSAVSELLQQLRTAPVRLRAHGGIGTVEERRLAPLLGVEVDQVPAVVELAASARLVAAEAETLLSTTLAEQWNLLPAADRWLALTRSWFGALPAPWRRILHASLAWQNESTLARAFLDRYPAADESRHEVLAGIGAVAVTLGLVADDRPTPFGAVAIHETRADLETGAPQPAGGAREPGLDVVAAALPPEVTQVYVQHDLSVIAPGPLPPTIDARIRLLADLENRGLASAYRISQASIDRALASGETEQSLRDFLGEVSLTGLPQALDYLLTQGGRRHGLVRVRPAANAGPGVRTIVETADEALRGTIALDHALSALDLRRTTDAATEAGPAPLVSRAEPATVYWLMLDARYPVLALDADGEPRVMTRARIVPAPASAPTLPAAAAAASEAAPAAPASTPNSGRTAAPVTTPTSAQTGTPITSPAAPSSTSTPTSAAADLLARLRDAPTASPDDPTAWITRQLDQAVRARTPLLVDVRMPDGSAAHLRVTPQSLSNGRLRCVDEKAGIERTVPVANILAVEAA